MLLKVFGPAKTGKTSLLQRLECHMRSRDVPPVYIDLGEIGSGAATTTAELFAQMCSEILEKIGANKCHADAIRRSPSPKRCFRERRRRPCLVGGGLLFLAVDNADALARIPVVFGDLQSAMKGWQDLGSRDDAWKGLRIALACRTSMELYLDPTRGSPRGRRDRDPAAGLRGIRDAGPAANPRARPGVPAADRFNRRRQPLPGPSIDLPDRAIWFSSGATARAG